MQLQLFLKALLVWYYIYLCSRSDDPVVFIYMSKVVTPVAYRNNKCQCIGETNESAWKSPCLYKFHSDVYSGPCLLQHLSLEDTYILRAPSWTQNTFNYYNVFCLDAFKALQSPSVKGVLEILLRASWLSYKWEPGCYTVGQLNAISGAPGPWASSYYWN